MITTLGEAVGQDVWKGKKRRHSSPLAASLLSEQPHAYLVPFHPDTAPTTCLTSFLDLPRWLSAPSFSLTVPCRFLSGLVKCIAEGSSRLCPEALAFHILAALLVQPHLLPVRPISPSQSPRKHSYSLCFFSPHLLSLLNMACYVQLNLAFCFYYYIRNCYRGFKEIVHTKLKCQPSRNSDVNTLFLAKISIVASKPGAMFI